MSEEMNDMYEDAPKKKSNVWWIILIVAAVHRCFIRLV